VKTVVLACDAAWERLGREIDGCAEQIRAMRSQDVSARETAELDSAEHLLEDMRARAENDPLSASSDFDGAIAPVLKRVSAALEERARLRREIDSGLKAAEAAQGALAQLHRESAAVY